MKRALEETPKKTKVLKRSEEQLNEETTTKVNKDGLAKKKSSTKLKSTNKDSDKNGQTLGGNNSVPEIVAEVSTETSSKTTSLPSDKQKPQLNPEQKVKSLQMKVTPKNSLQKVMLNDIKVLVKRIEQVESRNIQLKNLITKLDEQRKNLKTGSEEVETPDLLKDLLSLKDFNRTLLEGNELKEQMLQVTKEQIEEQRNQNKKLLNELDETKKKLCSNSHDFDRQIKKLKNDLNNFTEAKQSLQEKTQALNKDLEEKIDQLSELEKKLVQEKTEYHSKIKNLTLELDKLKKIQSELQKEKAVFLSNLEKLREMDAVKSVEIETTNKKLQTVTASLQCITGRLKAERKRMTKRIEELETKKSFLTKQSEINLFEIKRNTAKITELQNQVDKAEKIHQNLRKELDSKEKEINKLRMNLDALVDTIGSEKLKMDKEKETIAAEKLSLKRLSKLLDFKINLINLQLTPKLSVNDKSCQVNDLQNNTNNESQEDTKIFEVDLNSSSNNRKSKPNKKLLEIQVENIRLPDVIIKKEDFSTRRSLDKQQNIKKVIIPEVFKEKKSFNIRKTTGWAKYDELQKKYNQVKKLNENLKREKREISFLLEKQQEKFKISRNDTQKFQELETNFATLKDDLGKLKRDYRALLEEHTNLKIEFGKQQEEKEQLLKDNCEIRELSKQYNSTLEYLQQCYDSYIHGDCTFHVKAFINLQERYKELEKECEKLKNQNAELDEQYGKFASEISILRQECEKVKEDEVTSSNIPSFC